MDSVFDEVSRLRRFSGPPAEFWPSLISSLAQLVGAQRGILVVGQPAFPDKLRKLADWSRTGQANPAIIAFQKALQRLAVQTMESGQSSEVLADGTLPESSQMAVGIRLRIQGGSDQCVALFLVPDTTAAQVQEGLFRLGLVTDIPLDYQAQRAGQQSQVASDKFTSVLDVLSLVNAEKRFLGALMALTNGLAAQFQCERVSIGWLEGGYIRLKSISRTERFDPKMLAVQALEKAMEEALDQDQEILWPAVEDSKLITRDHAALAKELSVSHMVSVPIRLEGRGVAVLTCERQEGAFSEVTVQQLRLLGDQVARRLADLHRDDRWFGARWAYALREQASKWVGPEHVWPKVAAILGAVFLLASLLPIYPYRVEGNFILRSEELSFITAPFEAYIQTVSVRPGDVVTNGSPLVKFHTEQLDLEESAAIADQTRYQREAEKARASRNLAEMRIAQAQADQAAARLGLVRHRLSQSTLRAPFNGVVVEGDLRQRIGAPVRQGDALYKFARIDPLYVEMEINEQDAHEILGRSKGEIAFVAQPKSKFPVLVHTVEPSAQPKKNGNIFLVRAQLTEQPQSWWRPGMSGVCKIDVEKRTLLWILTHRTVDFLRLFFWW